MSNLLRRCGSIETESLEASKASRGTKLIDDCLQKEFKKQNLDFLYPFHFFKIADLPVHHGKKILWSQQRERARVRLKG